MGQKKRLSKNISPRSRSDVLVGLLQAIEEVTPSVLEDLRRDVLPEVRAIAERFTGETTEIHSTLMASKSKYHQWAHRYNLVCSDLEKAVVLAATAEFLKLSQGPTPAHIIQGVPYDTDDEPIVLAEYLDRHGKPVFSRTPLFTEMFGKTYLNLPPPKKFMFECSAYDQQQLTVGEWKDQVRRCFEAAMEEHVSTPTVQRAEHLTIRAPDYFRWTALYLCGPRSDGSGSGWSDSEIAEHDLPQDATHDGEMRKKLLPSRRDQVKKGRSKIMSLLGIEPRPPRKPGRPRRPSRA